MSGTNAFSIPSTLELKIDLTDEQFWQLCQDNDDLEFERTATGELLILSPTGGKTGRRNANLSCQLANWSQKNSLGIVFDSSVGFILPNRAIRSPDASWITQDKWNGLTPEQKEKFVPFCPDFVVELLSRNDTLAKLEQKMEEYRGNGAKLGWLIDPKNKKVEIYRPNQKVERLESPTKLLGENILPGFTLDLVDIF